ncbi:uncharacterized protein N7496_001526 [Penicillium cataractarum]|uniref:Xylanolytic transcriptional activator regulatory domain-containing protein n=1 Tax=Penicillium cataractarum TaxID=2100454 RepID=A0A9W9VW72_9EURO|nr:uncharacterized protein N7496_001526 [Penicillium cataractarum]KAJ5390458.1 hypothetical protein N7496_001526 [Penicillium cataractarum]
MASSVPVERASTAERRDLNVPLNSTLVSTVNYIGKKTQEMVSNAGEPTAIIVDSLLAEQTDTNPKRPQNTLVSPGPTDTLPSNNGTGDSLQWDLEYPSAVDQLHQQHSLETTAYSEVENGYTSLAQGWELQVPMDYWDLDLPVNMEAFEPESTILGPKTVSTLSETGRVSGIFSFAGDQTETNLQPAIPVGLFIAKDPRVNSFIGLHSAGSTLAICLKDCSASSQILGQLDHVQFLFNAGPHINECNVPEETKTLSREFPARDFAEFGIRAYFRNIHPIYPIIDRQIFLENWPSLYNTEPEQLDAITYSAFVLLVAIGALSDSSRCGVTDYQTSVLKLYWQSWYLLDKVTGSPFLPSVQVLVLHVILQIQLNKEGFAWVLCGTASRMAQSLGLHRRSPTRFNLGEPEVYLRSHLWWAILSLDSFLSAVECRPPSLPPSMCDHDILPLNINTLPMDACTGDVADTYYWSLRLTRIRHEYCVIVNRCESVYSRLDALATLDHRLLQWREEVPPDIRPGQQIIAPKALYHFVALLHLDYFHILCSIHWASILSTTNPVILKAHQSIRIQSSEHICVAAARSFVDVLNGLNTEYDGSTLFPIT